MDKKDIQTIDKIIDQGNHAEVYKRPKTGEVVILEVKKEIKSGK